MFSRKEYIYIYIVLYIKWIGPKSEPLGELLHCDMKVSEQATVELKVQEDNQATTRVVRKGFSPKLRHISRTHKITLGSLREVMFETNICLEYVDTAEQAADIFAKALPIDKWEAALVLLGMHAEPPSQLERA